MRVVYRSSTDACSVRQAATAVINAARRKTAHAPLKLTPPSLLTSPSSDHPADVGPGSYKPRATQGGEARTRGPSFRIKPSRRLLCGAGPGCRVDAV